MSVDPEVHLDALIAERRAELAVFRTLTPRIAEAHTKRIEAESAAVVARLEHGAALDQITLLKSRLELQVLQFAFEEMQRRALTAEPTYPRLVQAPSSVPSTVDVRAFPEARRVQGERDVFVSEMKAALDAVRAELHQDMEHTKTAIRAGAIEVQGLTQTVKRVADEFPSAFRFKGATSD